MPGRQPVPGSRDRGYRQPLLPSHSHFSLPHTLPTLLEREREGEEGEEEEKELAWRTWSTIFFLISHLWRLGACGWSFVENQTSTLLGFELGLKLLLRLVACNPYLIHVFLGSLPTSRHSGDSHRDSYSPCGIGRRSGLPWARLIPRVGMMTTTGPLGSAPARQPTGGSQGHRQPSGGSLQTYGGSGHVPGGLPLGPGA
uniref:Uncharacterized protein n=1 Tax=Ananas comosus var. bracteatus TaxID=296719 RepID=A0A6V7P1T5_ANACO|nr:unnamed protein product [Ananas comosus var. bracteatus]